MKSKSGIIWKPDEQWTFVPGESTSKGFIANTKDTALGVSGDSVIEVTSYQNDTEHIWEKGEPDKKGYFTLTSVKTQKVLTAISDEIIEIRGRNMIQLNCFIFFSINMFYFFISHQTMIFIHQKFW